MKGKGAGLIGAAIFVAPGLCQLAIAAPDPQVVFGAKSYPDAPQPFPNATVVLAAAELASVAGYDPTAADRDMVAEYRSHHHGRHWRPHHRSRSRHY